MNMTPELVKDFWAYMTTKYGTVVKSKADAEEMKLIAMVLDALKVTDKQAFLSRFVTTVGKTIYVPFTVGETGPDGRWSMESQFGVCMHEHQHVIQAVEAGEAMFMARYLLDPTWRAKYEGEAYRANMTLNFQVFGTEPAVDPYMKSIASYGLGTEELSFFKAFLSISIPVIKKGGVPDASAREALAWLKERQA